MKGWGEYFGLAAAAAFGLLFELPDWWFVGIIAVWLYWEIGSIIDGLNARIARLEDRLDR